MDGGSDCRPGPGPEAGCNLYRLPGADPAYHTGRASRQDEVADISRALAVLARTHKITVVALSQLSRPADKTKRRPPVLADLRESGQIEQDADAVMLFREDEQNSNAEQTLSLAEKEGVEEAMVSREIQAFIPIMPVEDHHCKETARAGLQTDGVPRNHR